MRGCGGRAGAAVGDSGAAGAARAAEVRALLEALPTCVSRDMCDNLVLSFCLVYSKGARKRMVPPPPLSPPGSQPTCDGAPWHIGARRT